MNEDEREDTTIYKVVVNCEKGHFGEQYSIWPADRENPPGWDDVGKQGTKAECLAYIGEIWDAEKADSTTYKVIVDSGKERYDFLPADQENPLGWSDVGKQGTREECLAYIEKVLTQMEPVSPPNEMDEESTIFKVVVNHIGQYSIWPADRENPLGWSDVGKQGTKAECLAYMEKVWT